ncbi:MAG TPA: S8 family serine peptidase [Dongiaceae bacterium]|nr:S8 family serine peptidase [Dongiaceae bacterium]
MTRHPHVDCPSRQDHRAQLERRLAWLLNPAWRLALFAPILAASSAAADMPAQVTLRATSALPDEVIEAIAEFSIPEELTIPAQQKPEDVLRSYCGSLTNTYRDQVIKLNPDLKLVKSKKERKIKAPACAKWRKDPKVKVLEGDTLESVIAREIGFDGDLVLTPCEPGTTSSRCGKSLYEMTADQNSQVNLENLQPGTTLTLPNITYSTTVSFDPGKFKDAEEAVAALQERLAKSSAATAPEASPLEVRPAATGIQLVGPVSLSSAELGSCDGVDAPQRWPFDAAALRDVLMHTVPQAKQALQAIKPSVVNIIDTGVADLLNTFPTNVLERNLREVPDNALDDESNNYIDDVYGISVGWDGNIEPDHGYEFWHHGTDVATLVLGGELRRLYPNLGDLVRFRPVNVIQQVGSTSEDGTRQFAIPDGGLIESVRYVASKGEIANLSVESSEPLSSIVGNAATSKTLLLVIAAGNGALPLDDTAAYPAIYGGIGELRDQAITVAAHDGANHLTSFSNHSAQYVDIAAPGCALSGSNTTAPFLAGTSFAAPLVSLTAAIVRAFGVSDPKDIKDRLYAASDYVPDLKDTVRSSGVLNIAKSIALFDDVLELDGGQGLKYGVWPAVSPVTLCQGQQAIESGKIRKITKLPQATGDSTIRIRILRVDTQGHLLSKECDAAGSGLEFKETGNNAITSISWSSFRDLVPSYYAN